MPEHELRPRLDAHENSVADFAVERFDIVAFCDDCGHTAALDRSRVPAELTIPELRSRLRCRICCSRRISIRIVFTGAGGYSYRAG